MSDFAPIGVPVMYGAWQPTDEQVAKAADRLKLQVQREAEDAGRAAAPTVQRVAIVAFTIMDDVNPTGRVINPGETFEISEFDLHKYVGRSVRPAP